jgi:hypothetical protein
MKKPAVQIGTPKAAPAIAPLPLERRLLTPAELSLKGIHLHINHLRRMWKAGKFPEPVYVSDRRFGWPEEVLDRWLDDRIANPSERKEKNKERVKV